ncbi:unnamed protein product [Cladocopium goreaui]|uniref:Uncharacterized protein n=1 Tax=Cladocopium goreaui TaxID=2562237 RepID=A0A9P1CHW8_9DINO|nr:unnamed protein product [Cladocopium goreaui]
MSSGLAARLRELSKEADRLQVAAVELAENISELCNPGSFGDWVLVDDAFDPLFPEDFAAVRALLVHHGLEDGFPPIPEELVRIAARALSGTPQEVVQKAQSAFRAGFLAHIALATSTPFLKNEQESEAEHCHWVVFYRHTPSINRGIRESAEAGKMDKSLLKFARDGDPSLLVWRVPTMLTDGGVADLQAFVLPLLSRAGGFLAAIPLQVVLSDVLLDAMLKEEPGTIGPSKEFTAQLMVEEEIGSGVVDLSSTANFVVVDLDDTVLMEMREYDIVTDSTEPIVPYSDSDPNALPKVIQLLPMIQDWIESVASERLAFYSAREEQDGPTLPATKKAAAKKAARTTIATLASQMATMQQQLQAVLAQQDVLAKGGGGMDGFASHAPAPSNGPMVATIPALSSGLGLGTVPKQAALAIGPPPRTKDAQLENVADVGGDPMSDLAGHSGTAGLGLNTKGVARRERMQSELAQRSSNYFLQVQQQLFKRMNPSRAVPKNAAELSQAGASMTAYLERYGGFRQNRDTGLIMWILAHAMDSASQDDFHGTKEYLALLVAALEQSTLDGGWGVAYVLSLMEEPPQQLFMERMTPVSATGRPFSPLVPPSWAAVALSYLKELEVLSTRKTEMRTPFSAFLHRSICLLRGPLVRSASTLTFFPVPVFDRDQFRRKPSGLSSLKRRNCHLHRAIHVICMALNFWFFGGRWVADDELKREPNAEHINLYARLASLIRSDGLAESFNLAKSGRKHPELLARLSELSNLLTVQGGASCGYEKGFAGVDVPKDSSAAPELTPFVDLDASRLRIYGSGHWDVTSHLHDELVLAYREPRSLLADLPLGDHPKCRDSQEEVAKLAHLWDQAGLLRLSRCQRPLGSLVKVFNCYKNAEMDRQIGDRSDRLLQGLVIDDYFAASVEDRKTVNSASIAAACYNRSQLAYEAADLLGSPTKDVVGENEGKLRIALSFITLALCNLGCTTDVLHLRLIGDLGAEYFPALFATDASSFKGAICWAPQEPRVLRTIWKSCRSKGSYTRLLSPAEQVLRNNGLFDEEKLQGRRMLGPDRPLAYEFDFIEVFSGASLVTKAIAAKGWSVGPPLDISISQEYDLSSVYICEWLTFLLAEKRLKGEVRCDSCAFGSEHLKPFRFLGVNVRRRRAEALDVDISGLENQLVNEAALASKWEVLKSWNFRKQSHINILEEAAVLRLVNFLATYRRPLRASALVDSFVVRGATSKGRSSSRGLSTILRRVGATCVAAALYLTLPFVPTRWNPADDPTRDAVLRPSYGSLGVESWDDLDLFLLSELPKTKRWASLWMRMVLRLIGSACLHFSDRSLFRQTVLTRYEATGHESEQKGFDSSLGFPGEGPAMTNQPQIVGFRSMSCRLLFGLPSFHGFALWTFLHSLFFVPATWIAAVLRGVLCLFLFFPRGLWFSVGLLAFAPAANAMPIFPRTAGERSKAAIRQNRPPVPSGRPVLPVTM